MNSKAAEEITSPILDRRKLSRYQHQRVRPEHKPIPTTFTYEVLEHENNATADKSYPDENVYPDEAHVPPVVESKEDTRWPALAGCILNAVLTLLPIIFIGR